MMPSNQFWFNYNSLSSGSSASYYLRQVSEDNIFPPMDGVGAVNFEGKLKILFGWNPLNGPHPALPLPFQPDSKYTYDTPNEGRDSNWTQGLDVPWFATHGQGVWTRADGKIWFWGLSGQTDNQQSSTVMTYDTANGWQTISNDWTLGLRVSHRSFVHKDYLYTFGGQDVFTPLANSFSDMYRSADGITWEFMSNLPTLFMSSSTSWTDSAGNLYITGGGHISNNPYQYETLVDKIYKSVDDGVTWTIHANLPVALQGIWGDAYYFDGRVWMKPGSYEGVHQPGFFMSDDNGLNWTLFDTTIPARHLTAMTIVNNHLHVLCGNLWNDHYRVERIVYPPITLDPDVKTWYEKLYPVDRPSLGLIAALNNYVIGLKSDVSLNGVTSNWDELDVNHVFSGLENEAQALMPLKTSRTSFLNGFTKVFSPTINSSGITGNGMPGAASGLDLNWNSFLHGVKFQFNFASLFCYSLSSILEDSNDFGALRNFIACGQNDSIFYAEINDSSEASTPVTDGKGYRGISRFDATNREIIYNTSHFSSVQASNPISAPFALCGVYNGGVLNNPSAKTFGAIGIGSGDLDHDKMKIRIEAYFTEIGVTF